MLFTSIYIGDTPIIKAYVGSIVLKLNSNITTELIFITNINNDGGYYE